ncbi:hypothetical protein Ciccas_012555 [Cichlidogyrus casuarinus]|uniref:N-acetyltransferase domain-containing protein n=1 Tax=Cichlidogyrus casuarinus TaxID=1844966 RepID=A0ABD2PR24_9PLAT
MATAVITGSFIRGRLSFEFIPVFVQFAIIYRYIGGRLTMKELFGKEADYRNKNYWIENEDERIFLVAYDETNGVNERKLVGFVGLTKFSDVWFKKEDYEDDDEVGKRIRPQEIGEYKRFLVMDSYQRCGIGKILMDCAEKFARKRFRHKCIYLNTFSGLQSGIEFYRKNGFQVLESRRVKLFPIKFRLFDFGYHYFYLIPIKKML